MRLVRHIQGNNYEIVINFVHISHNLTWYTADVHKFTRIYPVCSTYELTKQFMYICVKKLRNQSQKEQPVLHSMFWKWIKIRYSVTIYLRMPPLEVYGRVIVQRSWKHQTSRPGLEWSPQTFSCLHHQGRAFR